MEMHNIRSMTNSSMDLVTYMVIKDGKAWGVNYNDCGSKSYGWVDIIKGEIYDHSETKNVPPEYYVSGRNSDEKSEMSKGKLAKVRIVEKIELV